MCFIYAFDQPHGKLFVQKISGTYLSFLENEPEVQATLIHYGNVYLKVVNAWL